MLCNIYCHNYAELDIIGINKVQVIVDTCLAIEHAFIKKVEKLVQFPKVLKHVLDRQLKSGMHRLWLHASTSTMAQLAFDTLLSATKVTKPVLWSISMQYTCNFPVRMFASEDLVETRQRERRTVLQILQLRALCLRVLCHSGTKTAT